MRGPPTDCYLRVRHYWNSSPCLHQSGLKLLTRCTFIDRCCNTKVYVLCEYVLRCGRKIYNLLCSGANEVLDSIVVVAKKKHLLPIGIKSVSSEIIVTGLGSASSIGDVRNYRLTISELLPPVQKSLYCISIKTIQLDQVRSFIKSARRKASGKWFEMIVYSIPVLIWFCSREK